MYTYAAPVVYFSSANAKKRAYLAPAFCAAARASATFFLALSTMPLWLCRIVLCVELCGYRCDLVWEAP